MGMSEFDRKRLLELLNSIETDVIYCNPSDRAILDTALEKTKTSHIFEVRESEAVEKGNLVRVNKKELKEYLFTPPLQFNTDPGSETCNNCKYQPDIFEMCDYGKSQTSVMRKCPRWESRWH